MFFFAVCFCLSLMSFANQASDNCKEDFNSIYIICVEEGERIPESLAKAKMSLILSEINSGIKDTNIKKLEKLIHFPLLLRINEQVNNQETFKFKTQKVGSIKELEQSFGKIFNTLNQRALSCLSVDDLILNRKGFSFDNGKIWFFSSYVGSKRTFKLGYISIDESISSKWIKSVCTN